MKSIVFACALVLLAPVAFAQSVDNPTAVTFTPSVDHNATQTDLGQTVDVVSSYRLNVYRSTNTTGTPAATLSLAKPTPVNNTITFVLPATLRTTLGAGTYVATISTLGPGGEAASVPTDPFQEVAIIRVPAAPGAPKVIRP